MHIKRKDTVIPILENSIVIILEPERISETSDIDAVCNAADSIYEKYKDDKRFNVEVIENV